VWGILSGVAILLCLILVGVLTLEAGRSETGYAFLTVGLVAFVCVQGAVWLKDGGRATDDNG
jgi:hypothetical protein